MQTETAMGAALKRAGLNTDSRVFAIAADCLHFTAGQESNAARLLWDRLHSDADLRKEAMALIVRVVAEDRKGLPGEGRSPCADKANLVLPSARQPNGDGEGQTGVADEGLPLGAPSSPANREPDGQACRADKASTIVPSAREPSASEKGAAVAARKAAAERVLTVFDTWKVRDGRAIGDITFAELEAMRFENAREASICRQIMRHAANAKPSDTVRDVVSISHIQRMIQKAAEVADAA